MFLYWGRRGFTRFALECARAAVADPTLDVCISVSRQNENFEAFAEFGSKLFAVDTFSSNLGALGRAPRIPTLRRRLAQEISARKIEAAIELMPHVWSALTLPVVKSAGARYATVIHDAVTHPVDYRSFSVQGLTRRATAQADVIFTLSASVASRLAATGTDKIVKLFLPDFGYGPQAARGIRKSGEPFRVAFLGRILPYKGLPLFVAMAERLRGSGIAIALGVFGEGNLGSSAARLAALGAEVVNRWLSEQEIADILARHDALVLSHMEASQSGVAASAFGSGIPVVATPVGGLVEQVRDGINGVLAARADPEALAEAVMRLIGDPALCARISAQNAAVGQDHSMARFVEQCVAHAVSRNAS